MLCLPLGISDVTKATKAAAAFGAPYSPEIKNGQPTDLYQFFSAYQWDQHVWDQTPEKDFSGVAYGALLTGDVLLFELMLSSAKVDPNAVMDGFGLSLLVFAVAYRRPQCMELLLNTQVDTEAKVSRTCMRNTVGWGGLTALHAAVLPSKWENVNKVADKNSPLALRCVRLLIEAGANVNAVTEHGSVVMLCAKEGNDRAMRLLVAGGADVDWIATDGGNALMRSSNEGHDGCVEVLIDAGANVNVEMHGKPFDATMDGMTALHAAAINDHYRCAELLVKGGANLDVAMKAWHDGDSALHAAASNNNYQIVELLIDAGANVNITAKAGTSPMLSACMSIITAWGQVRTEDGRARDENDPTRSLALILKSRRLSKQNLAFDMLLLKRAQYMGNHKSAITFILPVLGAEMQGQRRWCGWCLRLTPDRNLMLCGGCNKIGYCDRVCCQKKDWKQGGHKVKCAAIAAETPLLKAVGDEDGISGMGMKLDIGSGKKKKGKGKGKKNKKKNKKNADKVGGGADGGGGNNAARPLATTKELAARVVSMSVKELKKTIADARLSHADCFEKPELRKRAVEAMRGAGVQR